MSALAGSKQLVDGEAGGLPPLMPTSLRDQARSAIRAGIIAGRIESGEIISVRTLAARLEVSATPVREAMLDLAREGLLIPLRNKGFQVPTLSDRDLEEILEVRLLLEVPALTQLAGHLREDRQAHYRQLAEAIHEHAAADDVIGFLEADRDFHLSLLAELRNRRLFDMVALLRDQVRLYGLPHLAEEHQLIESAEEHSLILDNIIDGDADKTHQLIRRHLLHTTGIWAGRADRHSSDETRA